MKDMPEMVGNLTREEWQAWQRNIEAQLDEYEQAIADYAAWYAAWRAREGLAVIDEAAPA